MHEALPVVWTSSIGLAVLSLASLAVLIGARLYRQQRDARLGVLRKKTASDLVHYALSGGGLPSIPVRTRHERDTAIKIALDAFGIMDEQARARLTHALSSVALDTCVRQAARRGSTPRRIAALEALRLFPGPATRACLEEAQASPSFRICLAALRTRVELGDLPDLDGVLMLTERPEGGRSLSLFRIVEACVRADLPAALVRLTSAPSPRARIMLLKAIGATGSWAAFRDVAGASLDPDPEVRAAALIALRVMAAPAALAIFAAAIEDPDWQVRLKAVEGIGQLGKPQDRPIVEKLLSDPVWWIRFRADEALRRLDGRAADLRAAHDPPRGRKRRRVMASGLAAAS